MQHTFDSDVAEATDMKVLDDLRTSLIVDPADGKVPPLLPAAQARRAARPQFSYDNIETIELAARCLAFLPLRGLPTAPPIIPALAATDFRSDRSGERLHVVERFERIDDRTIRYRATVEDPDTWATPWTLEVPFKATDQRIYEFACHEGNRAVENFMRGARDEERRAAEEKRR